VQAGGLTVRAMFILYLAFIVAGLAYAITMGLMAQ
jgi:hypothetical protein